MQDQGKTREQLLQELAQLRLRLEAQEARSAPGPLGWAAGATLERVLDHLPVFAGVLSRDGVLLAASRVGPGAAGPAAELWLGGPLEGMGWWADPAEARPRLRQAVTQAAGGKTVSLSVAARPGVGGPVAVELTVAPVPDERGGVACLVVSAIGAAERRAADRAAAAEAQVQELRRLVLQLTQDEQAERQRIASILHDELQQLLAAAKLRATMVQSRVSDAGLSSQLAQVADLLDQASDASRSLSVELSPPILQYEGLLPTLEWLAEQCQDRHGLLVGLDLSADAEPQEETVRILLFQAAREILGNVVAHAGTTMAELQVSRTPDGQVRLCVSDDGRGFDPQHLTRARGHHPFGLFSIQQRLAVLNGQMRVSSSPGAGTCVTVTVADAPLPEAALAAGQEAGLGAAAAGEAGDASLDGQGQAVGVEEPAARIRVLLADDHAVMRDGLATMLRVQPDIEVVGEASNGLEAVELALQLHPEVVIMDVSMPGLDGIQATRRIKSELPELRVIGLSMHHEARVAEAMREAGADAYFTKDSYSGNLLAALRS